MSTSLDAERSPDRLAVRPEPIDILENRRYSNITLRDVAAVLFRQRRLLIASFAVILAAAVVLSGAFSPSYKAEMEILVRHGRVDPVVTSQSNTPQQMLQEEITESELNSEVELLNSQDLLRKVVLANDLQTEWRSWLPSFGKRNEEVEMVNVTVNDAWIYEISRQSDCDYHLLIGVHPSNDEGKYLNAEISSINLDSPDAMHLWNVRKSFRQQYQDQMGKSLPAGRSFAQPTPPIHIRVSGSIFLDADHDRREVGHHDIKNFTSWEIHPITKIEILD